MAPDLWCAVAEWPALVPFPPGLQHAVQVAFIALVQTLKLAPEKRFAGKRDIRGNGHEMNDLVLAALGLAAEGRGKRPALTVWRQRCLERETEARVSSDRRWRPKKPGAVERVAALPGVAQSPRSVQRHTRKVRAINDTK